VDNLTHSLVGLAAAKAGLERASPYATAVCVVAANLPDIDIVTLVRGPSVYLANHRGITHSIVGTLALGVALPVLFFACERLLARLRKRRPRARFKGLLVCSLAAVATHPLLDWTNSYGLRPFLPWDGHWVYGDILFIIDPFIWLLTGGACFLLTRKSPWRVGAWTLLALFLSAAFVFSPGSFVGGMPTTARVVWLACLAVFAALRRMRVAEGRSRLVASLALASVALYCGALAVLHARAFSETQVLADDIARRSDERVARVAAMPVLANPFAWRCLAETDRATLRFDFLLGSSATARGARGLLRVEKPEGEARALVERASEDVRARVLLDFARFPVARVVENASGETVVQFADLRFTEPGTRARVGGFALDVVVKDSVASPNFKP
jgi:inner membrane protein